MFSVAIMILAYCVGNKGDAKIAFPIFCELMHSYWSVKTKRSRSFSLTNVQLHVSLTCHWKPARAGRVTRWLRLRVHPRRRPSGLHYIFIMTIRKPASQGPLKWPVHCSPMQFACTARAADFQSRLSRWLYRVAFVHRCILRECSRDTQTLHYS